MKIVAADIVVDAVDEGGAAKRDAADIMVEFKALAGQLRQQVQIAAIISQLEDLPVEFGEAGIEIGRRHWPGLPLPPGRRRRQHDQTQARA